MGILAGPRAARERRLARMEGDRALMARTLMRIFMAGATLGMVGSVLLPTTEGEVRGTIAIASLCYAVAALLWFGPDRLPIAAFHAIVAFGTVAVSLAIYVNADNLSDDEMFYLWVGLFASYFFDRRAALGHLALVAVCYAVVLSLRTEAFAQDGVRWLVTLGTLTVAALLVAALRERTNALIGRLETAARSDPLTGLLNRKGLADAFAGELARASRSGGALGLIVGDLDRFKQVNDRLGHHAGDAALVELAGILRDWTRGSDRCARVGGEEFVILAPDADEVEALRVAERVRARVRERSERAPVPITISFGVALLPDDGRTFDELLRVADAGLYAAKAAGRDRVLRGRAGAAGAPELATPAR